MTRKQRPREENDHADETWLIPYSDLLTLLLALFIVLFASSSVNTSKFEAMAISFNSILSGGSGFFTSSTYVPIQSEIGNFTTDPRRNSSAKGDQDQAQKETEDLNKLKEQLDQYIKENGLTAQLTTELNNRQLLIKISDNALFPSGSAAVKPEAQKLATAISDMLVDYPLYEIVVSGHTDNRPIHTAEFSSNWDLSSKRALNFMKILLQNQEIDPARFSAIGYGEYRPVASNDSQEGRAENRRVEVSVMRNFEQLPADAPDSQS